MSNRSHVQPIGESQDPKQSPTLVPHQKTRSIQRQSRGYLQSETLLWEGRSSYVALAADLLWAIGFFWLILPLFNLLCRYVELINRRFQLSNQRLVVKEGILPRRKYQIEGFKIVEVEEVTPVLYRLFPDVSDIVLTTLDMNHPTVKLEAIHQAAKLAELIRQMALQNQTQTGMRQRYSLGNGEGPSLFL